MEKKDINPDNYVSLMNTKSPFHLLTLKNNKNFCNKFFEQSVISSTTDEPDYFDESRNLVYDLSRASNLNAEAFGAIIDLLMQLRAAGNDQNVFIQNNTVVREQILSQLKNEILKVSHKLTQDQIRNLEVISSNSFDEKTLTDILKSLLEGSKKKLTDSESAGVDFHIKRDSRYITLDKISKSYLNVLNKSLYYEKVIDKILKNTSYEKFVNKNELIKLKSGEESSRPDSEVYLKHKSLKELFTKKSRTDINEVLEEITKSYEENVINKMGLIPHVIKLQSKISEMNILTKVGSFVEEIIQNSVPKILESETELINKLVDKSKIDELRKNIILNQQQYLEDRTFQERNVSRVYNEVRKLYNSKNLSRSITEVLKSTNIKTLNIEENVKTNLLKLTSKKDIVNRFKSIYDHAVENISVNRITEKSELINRQSVKQTDNEEKTTSRDIINLKRSDALLNKKFTENIRTLNIEENVKTNLLKLTSKKDIVNRFRSIYDHAIEKILVNRITEKSELINRQSIKQTDSEEKTSLRDIINIKHSGVLLDKKFIEDIRENNILMRDFRIRRRNYERIHKNLEKTGIELYDEDNFRSSTSAFSFTNLRKFNSNDFEDYFLKYKNIYIDQNKRNILAVQHQRLIENIENKLKKEILSVSEKEIHEKFKFVSSKEKLNTLKQNKIKPIVTTQSSDGTKVEIWNKEDIYKFTPVHIKETILSEDEIKNIFSKNIVKVLSPKIMRSKSFKISEKNIYKDLTQNQINKYIEKSYGLKKEYLMNDRISLNKESQYDHIHQDYMIYKEIENHQKKEEKSSEKAKKATNKEKEPDILLKEKTAKSEIFDTQAIEKNIMAKTLNKKDVVALIESYMSNVNVETISQTVMGKFERKFAMDKRRNGIF